MAISSKRGIIYTNIRELGSHLCSVMYCDAVCRDRQDSSIPKERLIYGYIPQLYTYTWALLAAKWIRAFSSSLPRFHNGAKRSIPPSIPSVYRVSARKYL